MEKQRAWQKSCLPFKAARVLLSVLLSLAGACWAVCDSMAANEHMIASYKNNANLQWLASKLVMVEKIFEQNSKGQAKSQLENTFRPDHITHGQYQQYSLNSCPLIKVDAIPMDTKGERFAIGSPYLAQSAQDINKLNLSPEDLLRTKWLLDRLREVETIKPGISSVEELNKHFAPYTSGLHTPPLPGEPG
jgi:hypothetical protein